MNSNLLVVVNDGGTGLSFKPQITMGYDKYARYTADTPDKPCLDRCSTVMVGAALSHICFLSFGVVLTSMTALLL